MAKPERGAKRKPIARRHPRKPKKGKVGLLPADRAESVEAVLAVHAALEGLPPETIGRVIRCVCVLLSFDPATLAA